MKSVLVIPLLVMTVSVVMGTTPAEMQAEINKLEAVRAVLTKKANEDHAAHQKNANIET
jgi:hypothetical protein